MTEVAFHTGIADKLGFACRLLRKAWRQGLQVTVTGAPVELGRLDALLWTFEHEEFVPHARRRAGEPVAAALARTPIWLLDDEADAGVHQVLVNLGPEFVPGHARYQRVVELVGEAPDEVQQGRQRWRRYVAAGLTPQAHAQRAAPRDEAPQ